MLPKTDGDLLKLTPPENPVIPSKLLLLSVYLLAFTQNTQEDQTHSKRNFAHVLLYSKVLLFLSQNATFTS
ncbi:hypothetical protein L596_022310 [Steinernema carpocapsae]|uniref:Uncharacterized protein n=1 Tax=Steinernema carpocapsae TaxID=34508 RepID=A0A4V6XVX3_STECR|nr:hypothetical protein L596_022310 [Steinernema carpocapsae]